jgi:hypothetical protein
MYNNNNNNIYGNNVLFICEMTVHKRLINHLNAELNPICRFLALLGDRHIFHVSRKRVKQATNIEQKG